MPKCFINTVRDYWSGTFWSVGGECSFRRSLPTFHYHRLNSSSSPVLTATSLSYGNPRNSTPHKIKTPDPIEIKFGTVDYVGEGTRHANCYANSSKGASRQMGEIYAKIFLYNM